MMDKPLVSVLMTSYNRETYIADAIDSVLASTYTNFELIICDDGSTDNTVAIAGSYAEKDNRIRIYINEKNLGDYPNRNQAASHARGKYLKYQDSDDIIYPHGLQVMVEAMERFPEVSYAFCANEVQDFSKPYPIIYNSSEAYRAHFFEPLGLFYSGPVGTIIRRSVFEQAGRFSKKRYIGDTEMWMKLALTTPVLKLQPSLTWWRLHEGQEYSRGEFQYAFLRYELYREMLQNPSCPLTQNEIKIALGNIRRLMGRKILSLYFLKMDFSSAVELSRKTGIGPLSLIESLFPVNRLRKIYKRMAGA